MHTGGGNKVGVRTSTTDRIALPRFDIRHSRIRCGETPMKHSRTPADQGHPEHQAMFGRVLLFSYKIVGGAATDLMAPASCVHYQSSTTDASATSLDGNPDGGKRSSGSSGQGT